MIWLRSCGKETPEGYAAAADIEFRVIVQKNSETDGYETLLLVTGSDGGVRPADSVDMVDEYLPHDILVSKADINGDEIEGAQLSITGTEIGGGEVDGISWASGLDGVDDTTGKLIPHTVSLKPGTYTLHESAVPKGGAYVAAVDITFTVDIEGNIKIDDNDVEKVTMIDEYAPRDVRVKKTDIADLDSEGNVVEEWDSTTETHVVEGLKVGEEYTLKEKVFTYTVSEVKGSDADITYDENVITVKVTVTDNGDGTITAAADKTRSEIKFVNKVKEKKSSKTSTTPGKKKGGRTGDEAPLGILFGGLGVGAVGLIALLVYRRRRNSEQ